MDDEGDTENSNDVPATSMAPTKIALKVPSLFLKGSLKSNVIREEHKTDDPAPNTSSKKASRPMPASVKKRLDQKENGTENSESAIEKSLDESNTSSHACPSNETGDSLSTGTKQANEDSKKVKRPMPASVRRKLEQQKQNESERMEKRSDEADNTGECDTVYEHDGRREMQEEEDTSVCGQSLPQNTMEEHSNDSLGRESSVSMTANENPELKMSNSVPETQKINISLALEGIRLPTFKKPTTEKVKDSTKKSETQDEKKSSDGALRRTIGRRSDVEQLLSLEDPQYSCEFCDFVTLQKYSMKKHVLRIHHGIKEEKEKKTPTEEKANVKVKTCPICNEQRRFPNKKSFRDHIRKCKLPKKSCALCEKQFFTEKDLIRHIKSHVDVANDASQKISPQSMFDSNDISVPASPVPPEEDDEPNVPGSSNASEEIQKSTIPNGVLKRKLAQAFTNFASKKNKTSPNSKHSGLHEKGGKKAGESTGDRPMPASVKRKLEAQQEPSSTENTQDVDQKQPPLDAWTCRVCNVRFTNRANRIRHEKTVHGYFQPEDAKNILPPAPSGLIKCKICHKSFSTKSSRNKHERFVHAKLEVKKVESKSDNKCRFCGKKFEFKWKTKKHEREVHIRKGQTIAQSKSSFQKKPVELSTIPSVVPPLRDKKQCRFCRKNFARPFNRKHHEQKVHGYGVKPKDQGCSVNKNEEKLVKKKVPAPNQCEVCFRVFSFGDNRRRHEKLVHNIENPRPGSKKFKVVQQIEPTGNENVKTEDSSKKAADEQLIIDKVEDTADTPEVIQAKQMLNVLIVNEGGQCPICMKFLQTKLKRHILEVHKIKRSSDSKVASAQLIEKSGTKHEGRDYNIKRAKEHFKSLTSSKGGRCMICNVFIKNRLRRHYLSRHALLSTGSSGIEQKTINAGTTPSSYKIYKSPKGKVEKNLEMNEIAAESSHQESINVGSKGSQDLTCPCCHQSLTILENEYDEHKAIRQPRKKFYIACKICWNSFSHHEDFLLHMKFRHSDAPSSGMIEPSVSKKTFTKKSSKISVPAKLNAKDTYSKVVPASKGDASYPKREEPVTAKNSRRSLRHGDSLSKKQPPSLSLETQEPFMARSTLCRVVISTQEKELADTKLLQSSSSVGKKKHSNKKHKSKKSKKKSKHASAKSLDDLEGDHDRESLGGHSAEEESPSQCMDIAITSTFSQSDQLEKQRSASQNDDCGLNEMPCGICKAVFYSFEALKKHELYFHNVKTSKMCPICGVYPSKLNRHLRAHENKTVRCACPPCGLTFADFKDLREHNLTQHPGSNSGETSNASANKSGSKIEKDLIAKEAAGAKTLFKCLLCRNKTFDIKMYARKHIQRIHCEREDDPNNYIEEVENEPVEKDREEIEGILKETNEKIVGSDWDSDVDTSNEIQNSLCSATPLNSETGGVPANNDKKKRPMPASVRLRLESEAKKKSEAEKKVQPETAEIKPKHSLRRRPLPASVKAKLESQEKSSSSGVEEDEPGTPSYTRVTSPPGSQLGKASQKPKPARAMPASVKAKLKEISSGLEKGENKDSTLSESKKSIAGESTSSHKRNRPMPASMKAKLKNKAELKEILSAPEIENNEVDSISDNQCGDNGDDDDGPSAPPTPSSPAISHDDEHDEVQEKDEEEREDNCDVSNRELKIFSEEKRSVDEILRDDDDENGTKKFCNELSRGGGEDTRPTPAEIEEHERAVRIAMGELSPREAGINVKVMYQCKLCSKTFDSSDSIRRHVRRGHSEYGPEHTENLIEQIYEETRTEITPDLTRKRRRTTRYTEEEYLDAHDELEEDDEEAEVIIRRGTSTRGRQIERDDMDADFVPNGPSSSKEKSSVEQCEYVCLFCRTRKDSSSNIRRHFAKSHPAEFKKGIKGYKQVTPGDQSFHPLPSKLNNVPETKSKPAEYKCRICHYRMIKYGSIQQHIRRSHKEVLTNNEKIGNYIESIYDNEMNANFEEDTEGEVSESFSCIFCNYQTCEEIEYVRHYKNHTGVSPYQCQYCAGTYTKHQQLLAHIEREHTGAEFLNEDEEEFSMEDVTGANEIQVATTVPIQIDQPKIVSLQPRKSSEQEEDEADENDTAGSVNRVQQRQRQTEEEKISNPRRKRQRRSESVDPSSPALPESGQSDAEGEAEEENNADDDSDGVDTQGKTNQSDTAGYHYNGDLSCIFFTPDKAPGGLDAMDDLDGGMGLD